MEPLSDTKDCPKCGRRLTIEKFGVVRSAKDGRRRSCKECCNTVRRNWARANREVVLAKKREHYHENRERYLSYFKSDRRRVWLFRSKLRKLGIDIPQYEEMMDRQSGCCAICLEPPSAAKGHRKKPKLHVDHDHKTGRVRGLLCNNCNAALGYLGDNIDRLFNAIEYLNSNESQEMIEHGAA